MAATHSSFRDVRQFVDGGAFGGVVNLRVVAADAGRLMADNIHCHRVRHASGFQRAGGVVTQRVEADGIGLAPGVPSLAGALVSALLHQSCFHHYRVKLRRKPRSIFAVQHRAKCGVGIIPGHRGQVPRQRFRQLQHLTPFRFFRQDIQRVRMQLDIAPRQVSAIAQPQAGVERYEDHRAPVRARVSQQRGQFLAGEWPAAFAFGFSLDKLDVLRGVKLQLAAFHGGIERGFQHLDALVDAGRRDTGCLAGFEVLDLARLQRRQGAVCPCAQKFQEHFDDAPVFDHRRLARVRAPGNPRIKPAAHGVAGELAASNADKLLDGGLQNGFGAICRQLAVRLGDGVARLAHELESLFVRQLALPRQGGGALDVDADRAGDFGVLRAGATEAAEAFGVVKSAEPVRPARLLVDACHIA